MFIKDHSFSDEDTLLEMLFDFSLGQPAAFVQQLMAGIANDLEQNVPYKEYMASLATEEDRDELRDEEGRLQLAEKLMRLFDSFGVEKQKLYGINDNGKELLYEIDIY